MERRDGGHDREETRQVLLLTFAGYAPPVWRICSSHCLMQVVRISKETVSIPQPQIEELAVGDDALI